MDQVGIGGLPFLPDFFIKVPFILSWHSIRQVNKLSYNRAAESGRQPEIAQLCGEEFNGNNCYNNSNADPH